MGGGKSTISEIFKKKGYVIFSADEQAKELLKPGSVGFQSVKRIFGESFFNKKGEVDIKKLSQEFFNNKEKKEELEAVIHPLVHAKFKRFAEENKDKELVFYEAPLISKRLFSCCHKSVLLSCSKDIREKRLLKKGWDKGEIERRFKSQIPESEITEDNFDYIINNQGSLEDLEKKANEMIGFIKT